MDYGCREWFGFVVVSYFIGESGQVPVYLVVTECAGGYAADVAAIKAVLGGHAAELAAGGLLLTWCTIVP